MNKKSASKVNHYIARKSYFIVMSPTVLRQCIKLKWVDSVTGMMVMHVTKGKIFK